MSESSEKLLAAMAGPNLELTRDNRARGTGQVAVEYARHRQPSGIATTKAEWWAFALLDGFGEPYAVVALPTERLKALGREALVRGRTMSGSDETALVLVKLSDIVHMSVAAVGSGRPRSGLNTSAARPMCRHAGCKNEAAEGLSACAEHA